MRSLAVCSVLTLSACGAAPSVRDEGVALRAAPPVGAHYQLVYAIDTHYADATRDAHVAGSRALDVVRVEDGATVLIARAEETETTMTSTLVRLPPRTDTGSCELELHVDAHGALVSPPIEAGSCQGARDAAWLTPTLPDATVQVGANWAATQTFVSWISQAPQTGDGSVELLRVARGEARLRWQITSMFALSEGGHAITQSWIGVASHALSDGMVRRGEARITNTAGHAYEAPAWPDSMDLRWCLQAEGEPPCEFWREGDERLSTEVVAAPATDTRPSSLSYLGEACAPRIERLQASLLALPRELVHARAVDVPALASGASPLDSEGARLVVRADGIEFDGQAVPPEELGAQLEQRVGMLRALADRTGSEAVALRIHLISPPNTPLSALEPVLALLMPFNVDLIVATGATPARPALPTWVGGPSVDEEAGAASLQRALSNAVAGCPEASSLIEATQQMDPASRESLRRERLGQELTTCGCGGADIDATEALLGYLAIENDATFGTLTIPAGQTGPVLRLRRAGTTEDLVRALAARRVPGSAVRLQFR